MISMEQPAILEARDTNTIMLPFVTNFNNAHPATIIIATPALASAVSFFINEFHLLRLNGQSTRIN